MKSYFLVPIALLLLLLAIYSYSEVSPKVERPNIILILSDDMGYSDLGCYGGEIRTPNLDRLAANGLQFTQFYNTARCCPTRASLLTGCYPHQTGIGHMTNPPNRPLGHDYELPGYRGALNRNCVTMGEVLGEAGYHTLMTGKWHLGYHSQDYWPLQRGFDKFYGIVPGASNFFKPVHPRGITYGNDTITITDDHFYATDAFTNYAMQFIDEAQTEDPERPFFLYLAYNAPHWPLNAPQEDIARYRGKYRKGWDQLRAERYARMREMGLIDPSWPLTPRDARPWDSLSVEQQDEMDFRMAIYAAMVDRMDQNIGRLVDYLQTNDLLENTLIVFLNDNGACAEFAELGSGPKEQLGTREGYVLSYGRAWANASNTPYRQYKHWLHEGGMATPMIVHWPAGMNGEGRGKLVREYGFLPDIMATFLEVADAAYPENFNGYQIAPLAGKSFLPVVRGAEQPIHTEPIFWEHEGNKAVRLGKYKLVQDWNKDHPDNWELYDLERDRTEMNDLAAGMPDKRDELVAAYEKWADENQVVAWEEIVEIRKTLSEKRKE